MDEIQGQQLPPSNEQKPNILEEVEFGIGGILLGVGTFLLMLFVLNYFNLVSLSLVFPKYFGFLPHRQVAQRVPSDTLPASQGEALQGRLPSPTPTPILPIPLSSPLVKGVSVYYRLSGAVEEIQTQENRDLSIKLRSSDGIVYPASFLLSSTQTIVSKKGKGLGGVSLSDIKEGTALELVYTVDLKTNQSLVNQVQLIESPE